MPLANTVGPMVGGSVAGGPPATVREAGAIPTPTVVPPAPPRPLRRSSSYRTRAIFVP